MAAVAGVKNSKGRGSMWVGVVRDNGKVVAECGHLHHNRDQDTSLRGPSAMSCAYSLLGEVTGDPKAAARQRYPWMQVS
jgi:hypothetical protein